MNRTALTRAAGIVAFFTVLSRIFGFTREASLAAVFGASQAVDAYLMAQVIPLLFVGIVRYALTTTFIPVYSEIRVQKGKQEAFRMANAVLVMVLGLGMILVLLGVMLAHPLVNIVAPGFDGGAAALTTLLSRIIFPMTLFQLVAGIVTGLLHADRQFAIPEAAGLLENICVIGATLIFGARYGITAVAIGLLIGVLGSLLVMLPALARTGFRWQWVFDPSNFGLRRMLSLFSPAIVGAGATRLNTLVDRILASGLPSGRVAALNYAVRLNALAPAILGTSIVTVMYPNLAQSAARRDWKGFSDELMQSLGVIHFLLAPIAVGAIVLREPFVRIVYQRGAFDPVAAEETAWALLFLATGMAFTSMQALMSRAFFALQDTTSPMYIGLATVAVNIVANLLLVGPLEQGGLALGTSIAGVFGLVLTLVVMRRRSPGGLPLKSLAGSMTRTLVAAGIMGIAVFLTYPVITTLISDSGNAYELIQVLITVVFGAVIYAVLTWIMGVPELKLGIGLARRFGTLLFKREA